MLSDVQISTVYLVARTYTKDVWSTLLSNKSLK